MKYYTRSILILLALFYFNQAGETAKNRQAPNFYLKDLHGRSHFLNDYCGIKKSAFKKNEKNVVLLSFFATWCKPCQAEYAILHQIRQEFADKRFKIFLIDLEESAEIVQKYVQDHQIQLPVLLDRYGVARKRYNVSSLPRLFLINPDQHIIYDHSGFDPDFPLVQILSQKIDSLLQAYFPDKEK